MNHKLVGKMLKHLYDAKQHVSERSAGRFESDDVGV